MRNVKETMAVADENITWNNDCKKRKVENLKKRFRNWFLGIGISFLPLIALPFSNLVYQGDIGNFFYELFCDISVMFIGITFAISSMNDFIDESIEKKQDGWIMLNLICLLAGAIFYSVIVVQNKGADMNQDIIFKVNLGYFVLMFFLSAGRYLREIREVKKCS